MTSGGTVEPASLQEATVVIANLKRAMESREVIACAQGILMERHDLGPGAAIALLKRTSMEQQVKMRALAEDVIAGRHDAVVPGSTPPDEAGSSGE